MSIDHEAILFEMEAIKSRYATTAAPSGESSRRRCVLSRMFGRLKTHHDHAQQPLEVKSAVSTVKAKRRLSRRKPSTENNEIYPKESPNLVGQSNKSSSNRAFLVPCAMLCDRDMDSNTSSQEEYHSSGEDASTDQEMSQSTISSPRRKNPSFDQDEHEIMTLYSYRDDQSCGDDFSICESVSMSTIGGSSIISDWASVNGRINSKGGHLIGWF
jgi:hypothetical protein